MALNKPALNKKFDCSIKGKKYSYTIYNVSGIPESGHLQVDMSIMSGTSTWNHHWDGYTSQDKFEGNKKDFPQTEDDRLELVMDFIVDYLKQTGASTKSIADYMDLELNMDKGALVSDKAKGEKAKPKMKKHSVTITFECPETVPQNDIDEIAYHMFVQLETLNDDYGHEYDKAEYKVD